MTLSTPPTIIAHRVVYLGKTQKGHTKIMEVNKWFVYNKIGLAEREGFEPSIQVLARITV